MILAISPYGVQTAVRELSAVRVWSGESGSESFSRVPLVHRRSTAVLAFQLFFSPTIYPSILRLLLAILLSHQQTSQ